VVVPGFSAQSSLSYSLYPKDFKSNSRNFDLYHENTNDVVPSQDPVIFAVVNPVALEILKGSENTNQPLTYTPSPSCDNKELRETRSCDGITCTSLRLSNSNCGRCGNICQEGTTCTPTLGPPYIGPYHGPLPGRRWGSVPLSDSEIPISSHCLPIAGCPAGTVDCSGIGINIPHKHLPIPPLATCKNLLSDPENCGVCQGSCDADQDCFNAQCVKKCENGQIRNAQTGRCGCPNGRPLGSFENCGACGNQCNSNQFCQYFSSSNSHVCTELVCIPPAVPNYNLHRCTVPIQFGPRPAPPVTPVPYCIHWNPNTGDCITCGEGTVLREGRCVNPCPFGQELLTNGECGPVGLPTGCVPVQGPFTCDSSICRTKRIPDPGGPWYCCPDPPGRVPTCDCHRTGGASSSHCR
jgi:hypothetical protein